MLLFSEIFVNVLKEWSLEWIYNFFLISIAVTEELMAPAKHESCSGTRNLKDNISDLKAQIAANNKVRERRGASASFKKYWHQN